MSDAAIWGPMIGGTLVVGITVDFSAIYKEEKRINIEDILSGKETYKKEEKEIKTDKLGLGQSLLAYLVYYLIILLFFSDNAKDAFGTFFASILMGFFVCSVLYYIFSWVSRVVGGTVDAAVDVAVSTKQYFDEQKEKRERALQAEIDEMARQDQIKREKIINSHEYKEQQQREKRIEEARQYVKRLTNELADIPAYHNNRRVEHEKILKEAVDRLETLERAEKAFNHIDLP